MSKAISIIGGGIIGQQWAILFSSFKYNVIVYEVVEKQIEICELAIRNNLEQFSVKNILRSDENFELILKRIIITNKYGDLPKNSEFVMECANESLEIKKKIFKKMDEYFFENTIRMSSSSYLPVSYFTNELLNRKKCIIAHPVCPPYFLRLVEVVPASYTDECTILKTKELMEDIGQTPVVFKKETYGFALNRIQAAVYNSIFKLIKDDIIPINDVDKLLTEGLGPRWAFYGPLSVAALNGPGIHTYCEKYLSSIDTINNEQNYEPQHDETVIKRITNDFKSSNDFDDLINLQEKRNYNLAQILKIKTNKQD